MEQAVVSLHLRNSVLLRLELPHWVGALLDLRYWERGPPEARHSVQLAAEEGQSEAVAQRHQ